MAPSRDKDPRPASDRPEWEVQRVLRRYPELTLRVWARPDGVHISAAVSEPGEHFPRRWTVVAQVVFQPREVTEEKVIQWGMGALSTYLQRRAEEAAERVAELSQ